MIHKRYPIDESRIGDPTYEPYLEEGFIEESVVGSVELVGLGLCNITLFSGEENCIPHFHIIDEDYSLEICVCILSNEYYSHNGLSNMVLSDENKKILNEWMKENSIVPFIKRSHWADTVIGWEIKNSNIQNYIWKQPDYSTMINFCN